MAELPTMLSFTGGGSSAAETYWFVQDSVQIEHLLLIVYMF